MTKIDMTTLEADRAAGKTYLLEKRGLYYRPNSQGYTGLKAEAGRYSFDDAAVHVGPNGPDGSQDGLSVWHEDDAPDYSSACPWDVKMKREVYLTGYADGQASKCEAALIDMVAALREVAEAKPERWSGQAPDPQDSVSDVVDADYFDALQDEARAVLAKHITQEGGEWPTPSDGE